MAIGEYIPTSNTIALYRFNNNPNDSGLNGLNGSNINSVTYSTTNGRFSESASGFYANSSCIRVDDNSLLDLTTFTISVWFKVSEFTSGGAIYSKFRGAATDMNYYLDTAGGSNRLRFLYSNGTQTTLTINKTLSVNSWYNVVVTCGNGALKIYINKELISNTTYTGTISTNNHPLIIGARLSSNGTSYDSFLNGSIDELIIENTIWSEQNVIDYHDSTFVKSNVLGEYTPNANTVALYHFNGNSTDSSGNNNNGSDTAITYSLENGKLDSGAGFNGSTSKIRGSSNLGIDGGIITISLWVKFNSLVTSSFCTLFTQQNSNTRIAYAFNISNARIDFSRTRRNVADEGVLGISYTFTVGKWTNLVLTYDGTSVRGYIDANLVGTVACSGNGSGTIGNGFCLSDSIDTYYGVRLNGCIDEVIVENTAWSTQNVLNYYNNTYNVLNFGEYSGTNKTTILWHLNGDLTDLSGNNNHGVAANVTYSLNYGKFKQGAMFSSQNGRICATNTVSLNTVTFSCWAYLTQGNPGSNRGYIFISKDGYGIDGVRSWEGWFFWNGGVLYLWISFLSGVVADFIVPASINTWYNVIGTYDGSYARGYVNGKMIGEQAANGTIPSGTAKITVGNRNQTSNDGSGFNGYVDEVIVENYGWTYEQVKKYYTNAKGMFATI